ncbi:MAG: Abi family protein [Filifactoraceae bacterium]
MSKKKSKRFFTYSEQEEYLNSKGIRCSSKEEKIIIRRLGYFNLLSGYKWPFVKDTTNKESYVYAKGTTVEQIAKVKAFDDELRVLFLRYITKAEDEVRAVAAYKMDDFNLKNFGETISWNDTKAYGYDKSNKEIKRLIARMERELSFNKTSYLDEYRRKYDKVPTWLLFKFIGFSTFVNVLNYVKPEVRDELSSLYGFETKDSKLDNELLITALHWLRKIRNVCAHNERLYDTNAPERVIERYFELLPVEYHGLKESKRIIDGVIYLKYFLDANDYAGLIGQLTAILKHLQDNIIDEGFSNVIRDMGIIDISHLDCLLQDKKVSDYLGL